MFGFFTLDPELRITQWNAWLAEWTGRQPEEVLGKHLLEVFPDVETRGITDALDYALEFSAPMTLSWRFHRYLFPSASGEVVPQSAVVQPLYEGNRLTGVIVAVQDVRDRQMAEEELRLRIRELEILHELDRLILQNDMDAVLHILVERLVEVFDALHAEVFLVEGERLKLHAACNWPAGISLDSLDIGEGIVGQVALQRRIFFSLDVAHESRYLPIDPRTQAEGAVPIISENGVLYGVLNMESASPEKLIGGGVQDFLETLGRQIAIAMEQAESRRREQEQMRALRSLRALGVQLAGTQRITDVYDLTVQAAQRILGADGILLYALEPESDDAVLGAAYPVELFARVPPALPRRHLDSLSPASVWPVGRQPDWVPLPTDGMQRLAAVPLRGQEQVLAVLCLGFTTDWEASEARVHVLGLLAEQLSAQVHAWRLQRQSLRRLHELDALHTLSQRLGQAEDARGILSTALDVLLEVLQAGYGMALVEARHAAVLDVVSRRGLPSGQRIALEDSLLGEALRSTQPLFVRRTSLEQLLGAGGRDDPGPLDVLLASVDGGDAGRALLVVGAQPKCRLDENALRILDTIARMTGTAIQRATLHQRTRQQVSRLMSLSQLTATVNASMDLNLSLAVLLDEARKQLQVDAVAVYLLSDVERRLRMVADIGLPPAPPGAWDVYPVNQPLPRQAHVVVRDLQTQQNALGMFRALREADFHTCVVVPLIVKGASRGMLVYLFDHVFYPDSYWIEFSETLGRVTAMAVDMAEMFTAMERANTELRIAYDATIEGWAKALELRDNETKGHSDRVTDLTVQLAGLMGFDARRLTYVRWGALLHDIGKMGVPDSILRKPGPLTDDEWAIMRQHPVYAYNLLRDIGFLQEALDIPYCHHEKWDGSGYPQGLQGEQIPLSARLFAIVDVWDALRSDRPYRKAWSRAETREYIAAQSGIHFDPEVVRVFLRMMGEDR